jgi:hypothetical protein
MTEGGDRVSRLGRAAKNIQNSNSAPNDSKQIRKKKNSTVEL